MMREGTGSPNEGGTPRGEPRWPMTLSVVFVIVVTASLPDRLSVADSWVLPTVMGVLCLALVATDPGRITKRSKALRWLSIALVGVLVASTLCSTVLLVRDLI